MKHIVVPEKEKAGNRYVLFTGSTILIEQMEKYKDEMPFMATIKKVDKFYTLS
jgi:hypothetical protein